MKRSFRFQGLHVVGYLVIGAALLATIAAMPTGDERFGGLTAMGWATFSWVFAGVHQGWVALLWRAELHGGKVTARFGPRGFLIYRIGFVLFAGLRILPLIPLAALTAHSLDIPSLLRIGLIGITAPAVLWGMYSVLFYFGVNRAFGADHFDPAYRERGLELRGIFRWVPNAMYTVVLLALYHPGLGWQSGPALVAAAAHHLFVWVHYFCTERPDMREIYG